jgi:membrane associated rhomboid family serine protease
MACMQEDQSGSSVPTVEVCYRHPEEQTRVHCTRCERPICPACMIPAPVGHQCPECVREARREFRQGPGRRVRTVGRLSATKVLLVAILAVFIVEVATGGPRALFDGPSQQRLFDLGAMFPPAIAVLGQYWRLFTSMFLHAGLLHIAFNAYALWLFGRLVEDNFGRTRFLVIYFLSGFLAGTASYAFGPCSPLEGCPVGVGASGAIFGVFGAFMAYNYRRRHLAMAAANLRWAFTLILLNTLLAFTFPAIDWRAHLGGLAAGAIAGYLAEGVGPRRTQQLVQWAGYVALVAIGVALVVWRSDQLRSIPGFFA